MSSAVSDNKPSQNKKAKKLSKEMKETWLDAAAADATATFDELRSGPSNTYMALLRLLKEGVSPIDLLQCLDADKSLDTVMKRRQGRNKKQIIYECLIEGSRRVGYANVIAEALAFVIRNRVPDNGDFKTVAELTDQQKILTAVCHKAYYGTPAYLTLSAATEQNTAELVDAVIANKEGAAWSEQLEVLRDQLHQAEKSSQAEARLEQGLVQVIEQHPHLEKQIETFSKVLRGLIMPTAVGRYLAQGLVGALERQSQLTPEERLSLFEKKEHQAINPTVSMVFAYAEDLHAGYFAKDMHQDFADLPLKSKMQRLYRLAQHYETVCYRAGANWGVFEDATQRPQESVSAKVTLQKALVDLATITAESDSKTDGRVKDLNVPNMETQHGFIMGHCREAGQILKKRLEPYFRELNR